jgi:hypothetical protein
MLRIGGREVRLYAVPLVAGGSVRVRAGTLRRHPVLASTAQSVKFAQGLVLAMVPPAVMMGPTLVVALLLKLVVQSST